MSTYQWRNIIDAWRKSGSSPDRGREDLALLMGSKSENASPSNLLPFAPSIDRWTEEHYSIYSILELVLGNRKEVTPEDQKDRDKADEIEQLIDSGDPEWLKKVEEYFSEGYNIDEIPIDEDFINKMEREERSH